MAYMIKIFSAFVFMTANISEDMHPPRAEKLRRSTGSFQPSFLNSEGGARSQARGWRNLGTHGRWSSRGVDHAATQRNSKVVALASNSRCTLG